MSSSGVHVFIKCRKCEHQNRFADIPARRSDLAMFRGSEAPIKCKRCGSDMDTVTAYCGEMVGAEIVRRDDPKN